MLRIEALYPSLKTAEQRLAGYIQNNPERVLHSTIQQIQEESGSSYATVIRFCKRLGYSGFKELKTKLEADVSNHKDMQSFINAASIDGGDSGKTIMEKVFRNAMQTLQDSRTVINESDLEKATERMYRARNIYFIGTGISGICARYAYTRFFRIGIACASENDATIYKIRASMMNKDDVLFAISSSGRSAAVVDAARIAREKKSTVISLCDFAISPLTKVSDINLYTTPRNSAQFSDLDVQLFTAQINILDILFFSVGAKLGKKALSLLNTTRVYSDREKI